jgi:prepilin-type N-terminal cleavage/methylation domain-containing protein
VKTRQLGGNRGFTIVELMIALSVLSVLLVMSTTILIQIGVLYTKGVNGANLQDATRAVVADVSSSVQFSGTPPAACDAIRVANTCYTDKITRSGYNIYSYCVNTTRYTYVLDRELGTDSTTNPVSVTPHVLWRDTLNSPTQPCRPLFIDQATVVSDGSSLEGPNVDSKGYEVVAKHMRLTRFYINPTAGSSGVYVVDIWMAYGDNDLVVYKDAQGHRTCKGDVGTQYCAVSQISTTITGRVD